MIARIWHGRTVDYLGDKYFEYIKKTGVKGCRSTRRRETGVCMC